MSSSSYACHTSTITYVFPLKRACLWPVVYLARTFACGDRTPLPACSYACGDGGTTPATRGRLRRARACASAGGLTATAGGETALRRLRPARGAARGCLPACGCHCGSSASTWDTCIYSFPSPLLLFLPLPSLRPCGTCIQPQCLHTFLFTYRCCVPLTCSYPSSAVLCMHGFWNTALHSTPLLISADEEGATCATTVRLAEEGGRENILVNVGRLYDGTNAARDALSRHCACLCYCLTGLHGRRRLLLVGRAWVRQERMACFCTFSPALNSTNIFCIKFLVLVPSAISAPPFSFCTSPVLSNISPSTYRFLSIGGRALVRLFSFYPWFFSCLAATCTFLPAVHYTICRILLFTPPLLPFAFQVLFCCLPPSYFFPFAWYHLLNSYAGHFTETPLLCCLLAVPSGTFAAGGFPMIHILHVLLLLPLPHALSCYCLFCCLACLAVLRGFVVLVYYLAAWRYHYTRMQLVLIHTFLSACGYYSALP